MAQDGMVANNSETLDSIATEAQCALWGLTAVDTFRTVGVRSFWRVSGFPCIARLGFGHRLKQERGIYERERGDGGTLQRAKVFHTTWEFAAGPHRDD